MLGKNGRYQRLSSINQKSHNSKRAYSEKAAPSTHIASSGDGEQHCLHQAESIHPLIYRSSLSLDFISLHLISLHFTFTYPVCPKRPYSYKQTTGMALPWRPAYDVANNNAAESNIKCNTTRRTIAVGPHTTRPVISPPASGGTLVANGTVRCPASRT